MMHSPEHPEPPRQPAAGAESAVARPQGGLLPAHAYALVVLYLLLAFGHVILLAPAGKSLGPIAGLVAAIIALGWWLVARARLADAAVHPLLALMGGLALFNSLAHLILYPDPQSSTVLLLLIASIGSVLLSAGWFAALCGAATLIWLVTVSGVALPPGWAHVGFVLVEALMIAVIGMATRRRTVLQLLRLRRRTVELERTLADQQQSERIALAASRAKSDFMASLSHELRAPITAVIGYTDLMLRHMHQIDPATLRGDLLMVRQASMQLDELVTSILDLSKIEAGMFELYLQPVMLQELLESALLIVRPLAEVRENRLDLSVGALPDVAIADPLRTRQILVNLLSNACKYTERGRVTLRADVSPGERPALRFEVADTGIGIAPAQLSQLFQEYRQLDGAGRSGAPGTGLGLALSRRLARLMGGDITVQSALGAGSAFTLTLPLTLPEQAAALSAPAPQSAAR